MIRHLFAVFFLLLTATGCATQEAKNSLSPDSNEKAAYIEKMKGKVVSVIGIIPYSRKWQGRGQGGNQATGQAAGQAASSLGGLGLIGSVAVGLATEIGLDVIGSAKDQRAKEQEDAKETVVLFSYEPEAGKDTKRGNFLQEIPPALVQLKRGDKAIFIVDAKGDLALVPYHAEQ